MKVYDVTAPFSVALPIFEGDPPLELRVDRSIKQGAMCNSSVFCMGNHTGTHVDAPIHFIEDGATLSDLPPEFFLGDGVVVEVSGKPAIGPEDVAAIPDISGKIVLFKTDNRDAMLDKEFRREYVYLEPEAARLLRDGGARGVGVDYLSVDRFGDESFPSHMILLGHEMLVIEGLVLSEVPAGECYVSALPLPVKNGNGCPVRAVVVRH